MKILYQVREHLGPISYLGFVESKDIVQDYFKQEINDKLEQIISIDSEGFILLMSIDGSINRKLKVERSS